MRIFVPLLVIATSASAACTARLDDAGQPPPGADTGGGTGGTGGADSTGGFSGGGTTGTGSGPSSNGGTSSGVPTADPAGKAGPGATAGESPLRRLAKSELANTFRALLPALPENFDPAADLPNDNGIELGFALPGTVSDLEVKRFMDLAEAALTALGTAAPSAQYDCAGADETACARAFVEQFGKRAFRRPLATVEVDDLMALYTKLRTDPEMNYGFRDALGVVSEAMLQSPGFLYRWERGLSAPLVDGTLVKFDDYEMASRLAYFIWNSMPDDALFELADASSLRTPEQVADQARRLLADPRADEALGDFITQWLELGPLLGAVKDTEAYPDFTPELRASMLAETLAFSREVLRGPAPTFVSLLTANYTFADTALAGYYGVSADSAGRVDLTGTERLGLLTQAALLTVKGNSYRTSPVRRGKFILNRLLCSSVAPPPPDVVPELPPPDPTKTLREQMAAHRESDACAGCHAVMDSLGFAFEHFDGAGKYRELEAGRSIDASGSVDLDGATVSFGNARELVSALANSPETRSCFTRQWLRYALDRFEQPADSAATAHVASFYESASLDTRNLVVEITRTLPFTHRAPAEGEVITQ